jgi:hypothetical protein
MTTTTPAQRTGVRVELARYTVPAGERVLYGQRVDGVVRITDNPANGRGRGYLVERGLEQDGNLAVNALADYLAQTERLREIPMASSQMERYLQQLHWEALYRQRRDHRGETDLPEPTLGISPGIHQLDVLADALARAGRRHRRDLTAIDIADRVDLAIAGHPHRLQHPLRDVARLELAPRPVPTRPVERARTLEHRTFESQLDHRDV